MNGARTLLALLTLALAACAADQPDGTATPANPEMLRVIARYYEMNGAEENNACSLPIMSGVSNSKVVSETANRLVVDVTYKYTNYANRSGARCRGIGNRRFTLNRTSGGYSVLGMTGERRLGPSWRLW